MSEQHYTSYVHPDDAKRAADQRLSVSIEGIEHAPSIITLSEMIERALTLSHSYPLIFSTITGSHAFGYASPLSDYDVRGAHLLSLHQVLGFALSGETVEFKSSIGKDSEIDIATHDLKKFLLLLLKGNGNILEDLYSPLVVTTSPLHDEIKALGKGCITKMCASHYRGMAYNQQRHARTAFRSSDIKRILHTYRCLLTGIHLMRTGTLEMNIPALAVEYEQPQVLDVIEDKLGGIDGIDNDETKRHEPIIALLHERLDHEQKVSTLPDKAGASTRSALEGLLIRARMNNEC